MSRQAALFASAMVLIYATPVAAYDVSYSSGSNLTCPANSTLSGQSCLCNVGYKVSGASCVKDEPAPPGTSDIYQDIRTAVELNSDKTCDQLGIFGAVDVDMCQRYAATPKDQRSQWKTIDRPSTIANHIDNPWAPGTAQMFSYGSSTQVVTPISPPPPAPVATSSIATSTSETTTADAEAQAAADAEKEKIGEALQKVLDDKQKGKTAASTHAPDEQSESAASQSSTASGPPQELVELSKKLAAEEEAADANPAPPPSPEPAQAQTAQAAQAVNEPEDSPGFFARIVGFFRWLF